MARLEDLATGTRLTGLAASGSATVESVQWIGEQALKVIYRDSDGQLGDRLLYRDDEPPLPVADMARQSRSGSRSNAPIFPRLLRPESPPSATFTAPGRPLWPRSSMRAPYG